MGGALGKEGQRPQPEIGSRAAQPAPGPRPRPRSPALGPLSWAEAEQEAQRASWRPRGLSRCLSCREMGGCLRGSRPRPGSFHSGDSQASVPTTEASGCRSGWGAPPGPAGLHGGWAAEMGRWASAWPASSSTTGRPRPPAAEQGLHAQTRPWGHHGSGPPSPRSIGLGRRRCRSLPGNQKLDGSLGGLL